MYPSTNGSPSARQFSCLYDTSNVRISSQPRTISQRRNVYQRQLHPWYTADGSPVPAVASSRFFRVNRADNAGTGSPSSQRPYLHPTNEQVYQQTVATCGSTHDSSSASSSTEEHLSSMPPPDSLETQDLLNLLQELKQGQQGRSHEINLLEQTHQERTAVPQPHSNTSSAHLVRTSADPVHLSSKPATSKPDIPYRQPQLFVGRLASSETPHAPHSQAGPRNRPPNRPVIRALPTHDQDPIE
ncbi:hypothetical protein ED733_009014 [Metarhizium rileyi]|uniref:Uncharacterized protein n=1 Tax=Metarhizium rileyi (strain RCEF 4871) TaxID=1649241 RepID=A0A5C6GQC7_METRR|nr:hypothetical protein ED733_009014 [Metarhizium rileyi]